MAYFSKTPHKHAELIKAWAGGATIQYKWPIDTEWLTFDQDAVVGWHSDCEYRVKPEPKPDVVRYACLDVDHSGRATARSNFFSGSAHSCDNIMVVFDGETGVLKDVQLLAKE